MTRACALSPFSFLLAPVILLAGCAAHQGLPTYPWHNADRAIVTLAEQNKKLQSLSGQGSVTLNDGKGKAVRLDTAIVAVFPDRLRLRAWKMSQAVFDLTVTPDAVWMLIPEDMKEDGKLPPEMAHAADFAKGWSSLHADFYTALNLEVLDQGGSTFTLQRRLDNGVTVQAEVERDTLTVQKHRILDREGKERATVTYERYQVINQLPVPMRIVIAGTAGETTGARGSMQVDLDDAQVNGPPVPGAFAPPKRAERLR